MHFGSKCLTMLILFFKDAVWDVGGKCTEHFLSLKIEMEQLVCKTYLPSQQLTHVQYQINSVWNVAP